ncbi:hypothetical protein ACFY1L_33850 [Streptomyces sp. NPDC001663]|uniref:hypothetical protein n=1 Tax=Streptomyces sp. NPDC001663 TaxID=3364597 RepID=UPI0036AE0110
MTSPPSSRAISVLHSGSPATKAAVPSMPSTIHRRLAYLGGPPGSSPYSSPEKCVVRVPLPDQLAQYALDFPVGLGDGATVALGPHCEPAGVREMP